MQVEVGVADDKSDFELFPARMWPHDVLLLNIQWMVFLQRLLSDLKDTETLDSSGVAVVWYLLFSRVSKLLFYKLEHVK